MTLPVDFANATVSLNAHPNAHNATNAKVNELDGKVATNTTDVAAHTSAIAALTARVAALEGLPTRRGPAGYWIWAFDTNGVTTAAALAGRHQRMARAYMAQAFDAMMCEVSTAVAAVTAKMFVYNADANGLPTTLAYESNPVLDFATVGVKTSTFPAALPAGSYWFGVIDTADGVSLRTVNTAGIPYVTAGPAPPVNLSGAWFGWQNFVSAYATNGILPSPFPGPNANLVGSTCPAFMVRLA